MGTFSKIKKYSKPSLELDERIECLDKELKKTLGEAIANSTGGVYSITQYTEPQPAVPPTYSDVPDVSGITGNGFTQNGITNDNTGYNDISQLFNNDLGENPTPIIQTPPETPSGGVGLVWHSTTLNGDAVGYIGPGNKFQQVLNPSISGGTETDYDGPSYFGPNYYTNLELRKSFANAYITAPHRAYNMTEGTYITWQCWLPYNPYGFGALYNDYTGIKKTDAEGNWGLGNVIMGISRNTYQSDPGHPYQPGYTTLIQRYGLGDPNYYPGPVQPSGDVAGLGPYEVKTMLDIIRGTPGTPDAQRARDTLDRWAKPGSRNRETLIKMGILEQASAGRNMGDIAQWSGSGYTKPGPGYKPTKGEKEFGDNPYIPKSSKDPWDDNDPSTWPSIKNQVKGA